MFIVPSLPKLMSRLYLVRAAGDNNFRINELINFWQKIVIFYTSAAGTGTARQQPVQRVYPVHAAVVHIPDLYTQKV